MAVGYPPTVKSTQNNTGIWSRQHAENRPHSLALVDADRRLSFADLEERCTRCVSLLRAAGVRAGDRVAILLANRTPYIETLLAAARLGAMALPINTRLAPREIAYLLNDAEPRVAICESDLAPRLEAALATGAHRPKHTYFVGGASDTYEAALATAQPDSGIEAVSPEDPVILMYTSGTTGHPKGALLPHRKTLYNSMNAAHFFSLNQRDRVLVVVPLFHSFGLQILAVPSLYAGASIVLAPAFDPLAVWRQVESEGISFFGGVPTMYSALLDVLERDPDGFDLHSLRFLFTAGAAIPVHLIRAFEARGLVLKQGFGQTETSILCCLDTQDAIRKAGSVGKPVKHGEIRVVRPELLHAHPREWRDAASGETGEIVVRGPINMLGYWNQPEETAATLREDGWLRTGDLARVDEEGFISLAGRARDMYISGGENVYPAEVEAIYETHPDISEIAVVGIEDPRWGEIGRAYVVCRDDAALDAQALRDWGRDYLAAFKLPREFVALASLPRTETGKIQKHRLPR